MKCKKERRNQSNRRNSEGRKGRRQTWVWEKSSLLLMINGTLPISGIYQFLLCIMILSHSLQETLDTQRVFQGLAAQTSPGNLLEVQNLAPSYRIRICTLTRSSEEGVYMLKCKKHCFDTGRENSIGFLFVFCMHLVQSEL